MLAAALIVFREVLEAGLIIGVVLAATKGVAGRGGWIAGGIGAGLLGAALVALFAQQISQTFHGLGQAVFSAAMLIAAVLMLSWHIIWMSRHASELVRDMKVLGHQLMAGEKTLAAMATVVAVAVLREGSEVVLFLYGVAVGGEANPLGMLVGGVAGVAGGAAVSFAMYRSLIAIPIGKLFAVTNGMVALLAAGMAGEAGLLLGQAGLVPTLGDQLWDTSWILRDDSLIGRALHALVGYSDRPMGVQLAAYLIVLVGLIVLGHNLGSRTKEARSVGPSVLDC
ncbi:MAG: FTR1 family protein [Sphingomicrobium sp.]